MGKVCNPGYTQISDHCNFDRLCNQLSCRRPVRFPDIQCQCDLTWPDLEACDIDSDSTVRKTCFHIAVSDLPDSDGTHTGTDLWKF